MKVLFEEADGVYLKLQGKDCKKIGSSAEMKVAIFYEGCKQTVKNRYEFHEKNAISGFESATKFREKNEAKIASIYNVDEIEMRFLNGDGAGWIKNSMSDETYFQLDKFHRNKAVYCTTLNEEQSKTIFSFLKHKDVEGCFHI